MDERDEWDIDEQVAGWRFYAALARRELIDASGEVTVAERPALTARTAWLEADPLPF